MKEEIPDYTQYSSADLEDQLTRINSEKHPATAAALRTEMKKRRAEPPAKESFLLESPFVALPLAAVGIYCGYWALNIIYGHIRPAAGTRNELAPWLGVLVGGAWLVVGVLFLLPAIVILRRNRKK